MVHETSVTFRGVITVLVAGLLFSCGGHEGPAFTVPPDEATAELISRGEKLIGTNCYGCHSPDAPLNGRLAPPMAGVRSHYLTDRLRGQPTTGALDGNPVR